MSVAIRAAKSADSALVYAFVRELAEYEHLLQEVDASEKQIAAALFAREPRVFCDIAEWNGEPAGFALWFLNFSSFRGRNGIYLEDVFVRPAYRGWAVLDWNKPSIDFYDSLGATESEGWLTYSLSGDALSKLAKS